MAKMAKERRNWIDRHGGNDVLATRFSAIGIRLVVLSGILCAVATAIHADASHAVRGNSRRVNLDGPGDTGAMLQLESNNPLVVRRSYRI